MRKFAHAVISVLVLFPSALFAADTTDYLSKGLADMTWIALCAALVFLMQAGFALLESGMSRSKNAINVIMKNYTDVCVGGGGGWMIGYGLMFGLNETGYFGTDHFFLGGESGAVYINFFFQAMFAATATTIASGAMAERTRFMGYIVGATVITTIIYPVFGSWTWGGLYGGSGWLADLGFIDFAGSTVVHSTGAWCALAGIIVVGPRLGRFDQHGRARSLPGHNLTLASLGVFLLWFGWFGFNAGSTLEINDKIGLILTNTHVAACAGALGAVFTSILIRQPVYLSVTLNGGLGGLVAVTAGCASMEPAYAILTGAVGGMVCTVGANMLTAARLDDVVGAVAVHGFAGAWGTIAAGMFLTGNMFNPQVIIVQSLGVLACFAWSFSIALVMYLLIDRIFGLRADTLHQQRGLDVTEHAELGYPEFGRGSAYGTQTLNTMKTS